MRIEAGEGATRRRHRVPLGPWLVLGLLAAGGCTSIRVDFLARPDAVMIAAIEPGVTTRSGVIDRLGPPEEMRRPSPFERLRLSTPQSRKYEEAGDIFDTSAYTYASGRYESTWLDLLVIRVTREKSLEDRWRIEFGADDVVTAVSHVDEIHAEEPR
jgi:hypothetical protein